MKKLTKSLYKIFLASMTGLSAILIIALAATSNQHKYLAAGLVLAIADLFAMCELLCSSDE